MKRTTNLLLISAILVIAPSCATYSVLRQEVGPAVKQAIIAAGPHLGEAFLSDLLALFDFPFSYGEKLLGISSEKAPPSAIVPPPSL